MLKKSAKLRTNRRFPVQYSANLEVLRQEQSIDRDQIEDTQTSQIRRISDKRMEDENVEEKNNQ